VNELLYYFLHLSRLEIELVSLSSSISMPPEESKRKRQKQTVQGSKRGRKRSLDALEDTPEDSTGPIKKRKRENLNLSDWMRVYAYVDTLRQPINQSKVVNHFATRPEGALSFSQPTLSRKLRCRSEMEARMNSNPNALEANDHASAQDQMWNSNCGSGFRICSRRERPSKAGCSLKSGQCSRRD